MPKKPKKIGNNKVPSIVSVTIYGIFSLKDNVLIKVDLSEDNIWFEFDTNMYDDELYKVVKLQMHI
jgi:hypothetical protein